MLFLLLFSSLLGGSWCGAEKPAQNDRRTEAFGAFSRGESLSWDQLEVVAGEAGMSRDKIEQMKLKNSFERLIQKFHLRLEVSGFSNRMGPDEELRLFKGRRPGWGALLLNSAFWSKGAGVYDNDPFLTYLLFRAEAYYLYRSHYDAEHCAWIVEEESPSMQVLKAALDNSQANWAADDGPPAERSLEFRRSLDPTLNPARTLKALVEYALRAIAQKASDDWAGIRCRKEMGSPPPLIIERMRQRERVLAADFNRARNAMTRADRLAFQKLLKFPFRYARRPGAPASEPVYDPAVTGD